MKSLLIITFISINFLFSQNPYLDSLKTELTNAKNDTTRCSILNLLIQSEYDDVIWPKYNIQMRQIADKNLKSKSEPLSLLDKTFLRFLASSWANEGYLEYHIKSNVQKSIDCYSKGLEYDIMSDNKSGIADDYNGLGVIFRSRGELTKSIDYQFEALKVKEQTKDVRGMAIIINNLGASYAENGDFKKAKEFYYRALNIFEEVQDQSAYANGLTKLGHLHMNFKNYDSSLVCLNEALSIMETKGDKVAIGGILIGLGDVYQTKMENCVSDDKKCLEGNLLWAQKFFKRSLEVNKQSGSAYGIGVAENKLAHIEFKLGNIQSAKNLAEDALSKGELLGFPIQIANAAKLLYEVEKQLGNSAKALMFYERHVAMLDSVKNLESAKKFLQNRMEYDYNKQKEIDKANADKELAISEERENKQKLISVFVGISLLLVLVFAVIIFNRLRITNKQKKIIEEKNYVIEEKQKEILDSIHYAKRIQETILAHKEFVNENLPHNFIYFKPKDIVSGDFYWATKKSDNFYLAVCDSTGHGVPGAFMSLLNIGFLNEAITEKNILKPNEIFNYVRMRLENSISREGQKDGFDGVLLCMNSKKKLVTYAAANIKPVLISSGNVTELPCNRMPVGKGEIDLPFDLHRIELKQSETLYLYTDGYADQFGGPKGKKYKYKPLNELLSQIVNKNMNQQLDSLNEEFEKWKGELEQVDDVCIIGIRN